MGFDFWIAHLVWERLTFIFQFESAECTQREWYTKFKLFCYSILGGLSLSGFFDRSLVAKN